MFKIGLEGKVVAMIGAQKITAVIKTKNEKHNIEECLGSLQGFVDEIIVVDDQSTDNTVEIAKKCGARILPGMSRNGLVDTLDKQGFEACKDGWIVRLDADERMVDSLAAKLKEVAAENIYAGVCFARKNILFGGWIRYGSWFVNDQLRFFRADAWDRKWNCHPHTQVGVHGKILRLPCKEAYATIHFDYDTVLQFSERTLCKYAKAEAVMHFNKNKKFSFSRMLFKPLKKSIGKFIIRQGFRDGIPGVILAIMLGMYEFLIEVYLWDLHRTENQKVKIKI